MINFEIYPAIDLKDGQCVRLKKGVMADATVFNDNPAEQALAFQNQGAKWLHIVDLNGAFDGKSVNKRAVIEIIKSVNIPVQLGGGIRDMGAIEKWIEAGISRLILGTVAVKDPDFFALAARTFPNQIALGLDANQGMVAIEGWAEVTGYKAIDLAKSYEQAGAAAIIYTDIRRDGMMQGVNIEETKAMAQAQSIPVIASGGVSQLDDIRGLKQTNIIKGAIIGRALYDKAFSLSDALNI